MSTRDGDQAVDIDALFRQGKPIDDAIARAAYEAIARHKALNQPIVIWQDGAVRWLQPDEIDLDSIRPPAEVRD
jgi:hypothetical protein